MKIGRVDVCDFCGAAFTPHTTECPLAGEPPPAEARHLPPVDPDQELAVHRQALAEQFDGDKTTPQVDLWPHLERLDDEADFTDVQWPIGPV